jgi:hypothetical protein
VENQAMVDMAMEMQTVAGNLLGWTCKLRQRDNDKLAEYI